jgi:hypothetical protein
MSKTILFVFFQISSLMAYPSLFFRADGPSSLAPTLENLVLSGLIYVDGDHWCLWVNDKIIDPEHPHELGKYHLEKVTSQYADFSNSSTQKTVRVLPQTEMKTRK